MNSSNASSLDRRRFLATGLSALGGMALLSAQARSGVRLWLPAFGAVEKTARTLVLIQLTGGNDGLSTLIPYADDIYHRERNATRIDAKLAHKIGPYCGLHPAMQGMRRLFDQGQLAIVQGAGYPQPIRSHFKAMDVWHTGQLTGRNSGPGWIGKLCDNAWPDDRTAELVVHVGGTAPYSVYSTTHPAVTFETPASYKWVAPKQEDAEAYKRSGNSNEKPTGSDAVLARLRGVLTDAQESSQRVRRAVADYAPRAQYPDENLARSLRVAASLIQAGVGSRVISVELNGFDTHDNQRGRHDVLMHHLDAAVTTFLDDIRGTSAGDETLVVVFSEFGRRLKENGSRGTDHGVAGPMFVAGTKVAGGFYGKYPSLSDLDDGDLVHTVDFRSVYATVIDKWFGADQARVLEAGYPLLPFLKA